MSNAFPLKLTQVAVGIVHNSIGQVLFAQRPAGKPYAGWWEFPGGKIETDETVPLALARELREELGIQILDCYPWLTQSYVYPHAHVNLQFCHVRAFTGEPQSLEGQAFAWGTAECPPLPFLPAALPVLKAMQLPSVLRFTAVSAQGFEAWERHLLALDTGTIIVYEPQENEAVAFVVLNACLAWKAIKPSSRRVLLASCHPPAWWGLADGVHFLESDLMKLKHRPSYNWVGASVDGVLAMRAATALGCNYITVNAASGWGALGEVLSGCNVASYVTDKSGSLDESHLPLAQAAGAVGIAIHSCC
jgi:8-oxo-dGTP diphosphatase